MAINTEAPLAKALEGSPLPAEAHETEKLLTAGKVSKSFSAGDTTLADEAERNGHSLPYKAGSEGRLEAAGPPLSPSRFSLGRASSTATTSNLQEPERPDDYLLLAIFSCFCPVWPINILALVFSILVSKEVSPARPARPGAPAALSKEKPVRAPWAHWGLRGLPPGSGGRGRREDNRRLLLAPHISTKM